jgi:two-component system, OmpR family, sensor histidine kinase KdpD
VRARLVFVLRLAASSALIAIITVIYTEILPVNPTTVALTYLIGILLIASGWGMAESTTASLVAVACFNFFFLPPVGTFTITDPQNWVALVAFLITATVASQLSVRARRRNVEALARQRDLERLYALSRSLLLSEGGATLPGGIARHIADAFQLRSVGLFDARTDAVSWAGPGDMTTIDSRLRDVARRAVSSRDAGMMVTAIQLGGAPIGSLAIPADAGLSDTVLQSIANLSAIGLERARAEEATTRAEAARASSELRATVLDALAHEFKTPLTSMKAASSDLLASPATSAKDHELAAVIDEDLEHFQALVTDAVQMLRIDAGDFAVHPGRHRLADVVSSVVRASERRLDGHQLVSHVPNDLNVDADRELLSLALRQLLDNALKYSPPTSTIELAATGNGSVDISVRNSDSLIPEREQRRIFERFYRGAQAGHVPGTGMGLAIVQQIAKAHGGALTVSSAPQAGTTFTLSLPVGGVHA